MAKKKKSPRKKKAADKKARRSRSNKPASRAVVTPTAASTLPSPPAADSAGLGFEVNHLAAPNIVLYARAEQVYESKEARLSELPHVTGVSLGPRIQNGEPTGQFAIRLHVRSQEDKQTLVALARAGEIPLEPGYDGVPTDILVTEFSSGPPVTDAPSMRAVEMEGAIPLPGGLIRAYQPGTLGMDAYSDLPRTVNLTCAHILGPHIPNLNGAPVPILDGQSRWFGYAIRYAHTPKLDCALIEPEPPLPGRRAFPDGVPRQPSVIGKVYDADVIARRLVWILGATSAEVKYAYIDAIRHRPLPLLRSDVPFMEEQILIRRANGMPFVSDGDSGAAVVMDNCIIGIQRAIAGDMAAVTPILRVFTALGVTDF